MQKQQPAPLSAELRAQARNTATRGTSRARRVGLSDVFSNPTFEPVVKGGFFVLLLVGLFFAYLVISSLVQDDDTEWAVGWAHSFILDAIEKNPTASFSTSRSDRHDDAPVWTIAGELRLQRPDDTVSVVPYEALIRQTCDVNARSACWKLEQLKLSGEEVDLSQLEFATLRLSDDSGQWVYDRSKFLESARSRAAEYASRESEGPTPQQTALANLKARETPSTAEIAMREGEQMPAPQATEQAEASPPATGPVPAPAPAPTPPATAAQPEAPQAVTADVAEAPAGEAPSSPPPSAEGTADAAPTTAEPMPAAPADTPAGAEPATDTAATETAASETVVAAMPQAETEGAEATTEAAPEVVVSPSAAVTEEAQPAEAEPAAADAAAPQPETVTAVAESATATMPAPEPTTMPETAAPETAADGEGAATPEIEAPDVAAAAPAETSEAPTGDAEVAGADSATVASEAPTGSPPAQPAEAPDEDLQSVRAALEQALAEAERPATPQSPMPSPAATEVPASPPSELTSGMPEGGLDTLARMLRVPSSEPTLPPPPPRDVPGTATPQAASPSSTADTPPTAPGTEIAALPPADSRPDESSTPPAAEPPAQQPAEDTFEAEVLPDGTLLEGGAPRESRPRPAPGSVAASRYEPLTQPPSPSAPAVERGALPDRETLIFLIQSYLSDAGYDPGPLDGLMGPRTQIAIAQYQSDNGLPSDSRPSEALLQHLEQRFLTPREVDAPGRPGGSAGSRRPPHDRLVANYAPDGMAAPPSVAGPAAPRGPQINRAEGATGAAVGPRRFYRVGLPAPAATTNTAAANAPAADGNAAAPADADAVTMLRLAGEAASRDEHNLAIGHYTRALRAPGIDRALIAEALAGRATSYAAIGLYEKARADLTRSIDAAPENAHTYFDRARVYEALGDTENAIRDYTRAYRLAPEDPRIAGKARELGLAQADAPATASPAN